MDIGLLLVGVGLVAILGNRRLAFHYTRMYDRDFSSSVARQNIAIVGALTAFAGLGFIIMTLSIR